MSRLFHRGTNSSDPLLSAFQGVCWMGLISWGRRLIALGFIVAAAVVALSACSRSDDFGAFLVQEVVKCGGRIDTNAALPKLQARWKVKHADENGFTVYVTGVPWSEVDGLMRAALGKRARSHPERVYGEADTGVGATLVWVFINGRTEVECVRGERP